MTLYEINEAILNCFSEEIDPETGEIITEVLDEDRLDELKMAKAEKIENVACWIKNLTADAEALKNEEAKLAKRRKSMESKVESLKNYLQWACDGEKYNGIRAAVSFRSSQSVAIDDLDKIPDEYIRTTVTREPNKAILRKVLAMEEIPGAHLEEKLSTVIK